MEKEGVSNITHTHYTPQVDLASQRLQTPHTGSMVLTSLTRPDQLPKTNIVVNGRETTFLVDSGATHSVLSSKEWKHDTKLSERVVRLVGASGKAFRERFTVPLPVQDGDKQLKHSFLLSDQCPTNHLMCRLGLSVICNDAGLMVTSNANPTVQAYVATPVYVHSWDLLKVGPGSIADTH